MARLADLADGCMGAVVQLRMGLEETKAELETAKGGRRRALEGEARMFRQILGETQDLRQLAEGHYIRPWDETCTVSQTYAPRMGGTKQ